MNQGYPLYNFLDLRDTLIQGLVTFSCYPDCLKALETLPLTRYERKSRSEINLIHHYLTEVRNTVNIFFVVKRLL